MRFTCPRSRLADVAGLVGQAVASKSTKKIFECLRLSTKGGEAELSGTDLEIAVRCRLREVETKEPGEAVVPAALFAGILREIGDEAVTISVARQKLSLETDGGHFEIECEDPAQFPEIPPFPKEATGSLASADLRALVRRTSFAAGREAARFVLNGVRLLAGEDTLRFVATDGRRLATLARPFARPKSDEGRATTAIVGARGLQHFERIAAGADGSVDLALSERFVALRTADAEVTARVMDGSFPDYEQIVPKDCKGIANVPAQVLASRLRQVSQFASVESQAVTLGFREGEMTLSAAGGDGRAEVRVGIEYEGPEEQVGFNPVFLLDALKTIEGKTVVVGINNRSSAARISDDSGFLYVLMPVLVD